MSPQEYSEQQFYWRHELVDPEIMQEVVDSQRYISEDEVEDIKTRRQDLKDRLNAIIRHKIDTCLTKRQRDAIYLSFKDKRQEDMGFILKVTQEAVNTRLRLGIERLQKSCLSDPEIQKIRKELRELQ